MSLFIKGEETKDERFVCLICCEGDTGIWVERNAKQEHRGEPSAGANRHADIHYHQTPSPINRTLLSPLQFRGPGLCLHCMMSWPANTRKV